MARNRSGDDDSYFKISSKENLEEEARLAQELGDEITEHFFSEWKTSSDKITERFKKETSSLAGLVAQAEKNRNSSDGRLIDNIGKSILSKTGKGESFDVNWKSVGLNIGKEVAGVLSDAFQTYLVKPINQGLQDMSNAYETNFTEIAGRMGTMRNETYSVMRDAVVQLNNSQYKNAINANKELIPALTAATQKGFQGQEAISIALTNAVDKKVMPWLDTASDAWTNIQYNLSTGMQQTLKAQQLLLQESRSGNRLLQSGVINQLTQDITPILTNIDYNTVDTTKLSAEMQGMIQYYTDAGYDPQQAYKQAQDALKIYRNPGEYINSDKAGDILKAREVLYGGGISEMIGAESYLTGMAANATNHLAAWALGSTFGIDTGNGGTRMEDWQLKHSVNEDILADPEGYIAKYMTANAGTYTSLVAQAVEKVTHTAEYDNRLQNGVTEQAYWLNKISHSMDTLDSIRTHVANILKLLGGKLVGDLATKLFSGGKFSSLGDLIGKRAGGSLFKSFASKVGTGAAKGLGGLGSHLPGVMTKGVASQVGTGGGIAATKSLGATLSSIGGGSTLAGAGAVAAPLAAGGVVGAYGIKKGIDDIKGGDHKARGIASIAGGTAAVAGGIGVAGGMLAVGAANAWNPVGLGLLVAGGVTVLATSLHRAATAMNENEKAVEAHSKALYSSYKEEVQQRKVSNQQIIANLKDGNATQQDLLEARTFLVEQGLMTQQDAQNANVDQLIALTTAYLNATNTFDAEDREALQKKSTDLAQGQANQQSDKQFAASDDILNQAVESHRRKEYDEIVAHEAKEKERIEAAGRTYYPSVGISNGEGGLISYELWKETGSYNKENYQNIDLTQTDEGVALVSALSNAIDNISDEKKRAKLRKSFEAYSRDGFLINEYQMMYKDITDAGATTDTWNAANSQAGLDEYNKDAVVRGASEISTVWSQYVMLSEELRNKLVTLKAQNGDPNALMPLLKQMEALDLPYQDKEEIRNQVEELKTKNINDWLILKGIKESDIPKYNVGIDYVPSDRIAEIHAGEAVLNPSDAKAYRSLKDSIQHIVDIDTAANEMLSTTASGSAATVDITAIVEAIRTQTIDLNKTLNAIISALPKASSALDNIRAVSAASERLTAYNPATSNTRNLYST